MIKIASKRIDIQIDGKDSTSKAFNSASKNVSKLGSDMSKTGQTIGSSLSKGTATGISSLNKLGSIGATIGGKIGTGISKGAQTASNAISRMGTTASATFSKVSSGAKNVSNSMDTVSGAITGLAGGFGLMTIAQEAWAGATQAEYNQMYLGTKMSNDAAKEYVKTIQSIVSAVPGDDTFMNKLLSGSVAKETNLSTAELTSLGNAAADYLSVSQSLGKSSVETQADLYGYITTGNTTDLERDSILKNQLGTLENQGTVTDRINALNKALTDEGYKGLGTADTAANKLEEVKGKFQSILTALGVKILPTISTILDKILALDTVTGGWSTTLALIGGSVALLVASLGVIASPISTALGLMKDLGGAIINATSKLWDYVTAEKVANTNTPTGPTTTGGGGGKTALISGAASLVGVGAILYAGQQASDALNYSVSATNDTFTQLSTTVDAFGQNLPLPAMIAFFTGTNTSSENMYNKQRDQIAGLKSAWSGFTRYIGSAWSNAIGGLNKWWAGFTGYINRSLSGLPAWFGGMGTRLQQLWGETVSYFQGAWSNTVASISGLWNWLKSLIGQGISAVINVAYGTIQSAIDKATELYNWLRNIAGTVWNAVVSVTSPTGPRGPSNSRSTSSIVNARGPYDNIGFKYMGYAGHKNGYPKMEGNTMVGNCVDLSLGMMGLNGGRGSIVQGTWNGGPHVWYKDPSGRNWDPANKAINNTFMPPARGPSGVGPNITINGDVYGYDDFQKKVERGMDKYMGKVM